MGETIGSEAKSYANEQYASRRKRNHPRVTVVLLAELNWDYNTVVLWFINLNNFHDSGHILN